MQTCMKSWDSSTVVKVYLTVFNTVEILQIALLHGIILAAPVVRYYNNKLFGLNLSRPSLYTNIRFITAGS